MSENVIEFIMTGGDSGNPLPAPDKPEVKENVKKLHPEVCLHAHFYTHVELIRTTESEDGSGPPKYYTAQISIECADCGTPFHFIGVDRGFSAERPMKSSDGLELRAPVAPFDDFPAEGAHMQYFVPE